MDKNDVGFPINSSFISFVAQMETIPEPGVLKVKLLE